jgi:hypothetical protein
MTGAVFAILASEMVAPQTTAPSTIKNRLSQNTVIPGIVAGPFFIHTARSANQRSGMVYALLKIK